MVITDRQLKKLTIIFFIVSLIWLVHDAVFYKYITTYSDELRYINLNESIFMHCKLLIRSLPSDFQKILYSIVLYPATWFFGTAKYTLIISIINCVLMATSVFLGYFLGKEVKLSNNKILILLLLTLIMPDSMYALTLMSENLFIPLGLLTIIIGWHSLKDNCINNNYFWSTLFAVICYLLYLTKEIALAIILAYCLTILYCLFQQIYANNFKIARQYFSNLLIVTLTFSLLYLVFKTLFFTGMPNSYSDQIGWAFNDVPNIIEFFIVALFINTTWALLGYFYFPIVFPVCIYKSLDEDIKKKYLFTTLSFLITILVVVYTITIRDSLWCLTPPQHLRYLCPYFIPIFALFLKAVDIFSQPTKITLMNKKMFYGFTGIFCIAIFMLHMPFKPGSHVDQTLLEYVLYITNLNPIIKMIQNVVLIKTLVIILVIIITYFVIHRNGFKILFCVILFMCLLNRGLVQEKYFKMYDVPEKNVQTILELGNDISSYKSKVLYIDAQVVGVDKLFPGGIICQYIDTYLPNKLYSVTLANVIKYYNSNKRVSQIYVDKLYKLKDLDSVGYLLVDNESNTCIDQESVLKIKEYPIGLTLYKNLNPSIINITRRKFIFVSGWYDKEQWGYWAKGKQQEIKVDINKNTKTIYLGLQSFHKPHYVDVYFNNKKVNRVIVDNFKPKMYKFKVEDIPYKQDYLHIKLIEEGPLVSPKSLGVNDDERELSIGITSIAIDDNVVYNLN